MRIVDIRGGLANQVFQYIFFRFAQRCCPEESWYLDDSWFSAVHMHNGYELEKIWGIQAKMLSSCFDEDIWGEIIRLRMRGTSMPKILSDMGIPITVISEDITEKCTDFPCQKKY